MYINNADLYNVITEFSADYFIEYPSISKSDLEDTDCIEVNGIKFINIYEVEKLYNAINDLVDYAVGEISMPYDYYDIL